MDDIEISHSFKIKNIYEIAKNNGINEDYIIPYGKNMAKIDYKKVNTNKNGKLVLVTSISPTKYGNGKTTCSIGLADALNFVLKEKNKHALLALRQPSLGPVFGIKGGATGGGYSQVIPMEDINLHFTGDFHAITSANNLLASLIDNHIFHGNKLNINPKTITFKRCIDLNDRMLRNIIIGLGNNIDGYTREDHFSITSASEIMAIFCLSESLEDLKNKLGEIIVGYSYDNKIIKAKDINANESMTILLKDAIKPNLAQTLSGTGALIHGGPFANIAHGCNSIIATKTALRLADYVITEAGFGADLGAEKFFNIKCRYSNITPNCVVLVATIPSIKYNGENDINKGFLNLKRHYENLQNFCPNVIIALNMFDSDTKDDYETFEKLCCQSNMKYEMNSTYKDGFCGGIKLAEKVIEYCENPSSINFTYEINDSIELKIEKVCKKIYKADKINYSNKAKSKLLQIRKFVNIDTYTICIAKNQYSFSDNPKLLGAPIDFDITVQDIDISNGSKFIIVYTGSIVSMPGLPPSPNSNNMKIDKDGNISELF